MGDNKEAIINCSVSDSLLKKKHVAIAYHETRESAATGLIYPIKIDQQNDFADSLTKAVTSKTFWNLYEKLTRMIKYKSSESCRKKEQSSKRSDGIL